MGIKNLNAIIKRYAPQSLGRSVLISEYIGRRVAVDASVYMYKYKSIYGARWIPAFYNFINGLTGIHCVFVFDNKDCIEEKVAERAKRSNQKRQLRARVEQVEAALAEYRKTGTVSEILRTFVPTNSSYARLLSTNSRSYSTFSLEKAEDYISRSQNHLLPIYSEDFETVKQICRASGIATLDAQMEAEKLCAMLCLEDKVDAIMTEDTDAYVYCTPKILCKLASGRCIEVRMPDVLAELQMSPQTFVDMCILCGTDYAPPVPGIGPMRAYKFITTHGTIEAIDESGKCNFAELNYRRVREIFAREASGVDTIVYPERNDDALAAILGAHNICRR